jgi:hypothetical protein
MAPVQCWLPIQKKSKFMKIEQSKNENTICQLLHHSILIFFSFLGSNTQQILAAVESG